MIRTKEGSHEDRLASQGRRRKRWRERLCAAAVEAPRRVRERLESTFESTGRDDATDVSHAGPSERERLDRLDDALATSQPAVRKSKQDAIKDEVLAGARSGRAKVNQGEPPQNFTLGEQIGLEAVILTNGERPSLFVRDGFVDLNAPDIGDWDWA